MALGLILGIGRAFRRKRASSLDILTSKRSPKGYYKGKNCKPTGFHTRKDFIPDSSKYESGLYKIFKLIERDAKCGYVVVPEKLPNYVVPDLTGFKLKPYVSQCAIGASESSK